MSKHKKPRAPAPQEKVRFFTPGVIVGTVVLLAALAAWPLYWWLHDTAHHSRSAHIARPATVAVLGGKLVFADVAAQSRQFIGYYSSIRLAAEHEAIKREVLAPMPAACCKNSNALTCCCTCNLSKTIWGLSNYVLAQHGANADQLRKTVRAWKDHVNPAGYSGDTCYSGGCSRALDDNGCGGMSESNLVL
ncbi:MAG: hypothetical protein ACYC7A_03970 [Thermoanaerobaculia bacterium]